MPNTNTAAIESLHTFAINNNEIEFAHLCTAALAGDELAVERVSDTLQKIEDAQVANGLNTGGTAYTLDVIRATDTTRPDGAIARKFEI